MTPDERVDHIVRMMLKGQWKGMASRETLAAEWKCHERTVGYMAERAAAVVARRGQPIEQEIDAALADLEHIKRVALDNERCTVDKDGGEHFFASPMLREATEAIKLKLEIRGALFKGRAKEADKSSSDEYAKLTRAERIAKLKEALAEEERARGDELQ